MEYAFQIKPHANARYAQSMDKLALLEMQCLLDSLSQEAIVKQEKLAGTRFIIVETEPIDKREWEILSCHSGVCFAALKDGDWLKPLQLEKADYFSADLAQILKYKGKTNADFTLMMLHCAKAASAFGLSRDPLVVMDPLCGRGTTLFCALQEGYHAAGVEIDKKAIHEADTYLSRYLKYNRYKHKRNLFSATLPEGAHAQEIRYQLSDNLDRAKAGQWQSLRIFQGDAANAANMLGGQSCHLVVTDLPYGVQHAGKDKQGKQPLQQLIDHVFPAVYKVLQKGGAAAISFNTYTLKRHTVCEAMERANLKPLTDHPYNGFAHWVEQAVNRDMVVAVKE